MKMISNQDYLERVRDYREDDWDVIFTLKKLQSVLEDSLFELL